MTDVTKPLRRKTVKDTMAKKQSKKKKREPTLEESLAKMKRACNYEPCTREQFFNLLSRFIGAKVVDPG